MRVARRSPLSCNLSLSLSQGFLPVHTIEPKTLMVKKIAALCPFFLSLNALWEFMAFG